MAGNALFKLSYGLYVVGAKSGEKVNAQVANTVFQITSDPAIVAVGLNKNNYTNELAKEGGLISINALSVHAPLDLVGNFGFHSGRDFAKFAAYPYVTGETGAPLLTGEAIAGHIELQVQQTVDLATHTLFLGQVVAQNAFDYEPMTYAFYRQLKSGAAPAAAPAPAPKANGKAYKCNVCGYIAEDFENLPDDWVCPVCGVGKDMFSPLEEEEAVKSQTKGKAYKCNVCGYIAEDFENLPDDWVCPVCGVGKDMFSPLED